MSVCGAKADYSYCSTGSEWDGSDEYGVARGEVVLFFVTGVAEEVGGFGEREVPGNGSKLNF